MHIYKIRVSGCSKYNVILFAKYLISLTDHMLTDFILSVLYFFHHQQLRYPNISPLSQGALSHCVRAPPVRTRWSYLCNRPVRRERADSNGAGGPAPGPRVPLDPTVDYARPLLIYRRDAMPVRRGHVAPQTTFVDSIIRKFEGLSEYHYLLHNLSSFQNYLFILNLHFFIRYSMP